MKQNERLIEIDQVRPDVILLSNKHGTSLLKKIERRGGLALAAESDCQIRQTLGGLIVHVQLAELLVRLPGSGCSLVVEVQLDIDLRQIEIAQGQVVIVAGRAAGFAGRTEAFDGTTII